MKRLELHGHIFGALTVEKCDGPNQEGAITWLCRCDCGNYVSVRGSDLKRGFTKSCGCAVKEILLRRNTTHGGSKTRVYRIWQAMIDRTSNQRASRYSYYGGRGISVCDEWSDFESFRLWAMSNGYSDSLSIDRINNDGNYRPDNCRWATQKMQVQNRRSRAEMNAHKQGENDRGLS